MASFDPEYHVTRFHRAFDATQLNLLAIRVFCLRTYDHVAIPGLEVLLSQRVGAKVLLLASPRLKQSVLQEAWFADLVIVLILLDDGGIDILLECLILLVQLVVDLSAHREE